MGAAELVDARDGGLVRVQGSGAELFRGIERGLSAVDGDDAGAGGAGDHDARQADAAAADDGDGLAGLDAALHRDGVIGSAEAAAQPRGNIEVELIR